MSEISKGALTSENNNSFPNNNTGYITPTILRTFNQNMIDSLVDEISYTAESASFNQRINNLDPSGSAQAIAALNAFTQSQTAFNTAATASIVALQNFSSSLDATFATDAQLTALSTSVAVTDSGQDSKINSLINATGSYITSAQTGSFVTEAETGSFITSAQTASMSVASSSFATTASFALNGGGGSVDTGSLLTTSSFNSYTQSNDSKVNALISATGSYITAAQTSSMTVLSASFAQTASFLLGSVASASFATSASYAVTASYSQNVIVTARNQNASTLGAGTVVRIVDAVGDNPIFNTASFQSESLSSNTLGVLRNSIASGADGDVVVIGTVLGVNTDPALGYVAGDIIYLSSSGQFTRVQPQAPDNIVVVGEVLRAQQNNGSIFVNISNGWELNELHNVRIVNPLQGEILAYNSASALWENSSSAELGLATTGSNTFVGKQIVSQSLLVRSGSIYSISNNTTVNPELYYTESQGGQANIIRGWGDDPAASGVASNQANFTSSFRITGSNNIVSIPLQRATAIGGGTADMTGYISGSSNILTSNVGGIYLNSGSQLFPKTIANTISANSNLLMTFTTSSLGTPNVNNNILNGGNFVINHPSGSVTAASLNFLLGGNISSSQAFVTNIRPNINQNIVFGNAHTLRHISSSTNYTANMGNAPVIVENHMSSSGISNNALNFYNNLLWGGSSGATHNIYVSGSQNSNATRNIIDNIIGGRNINVSSSFVSSSNSNLLASLIYGQSLFVSGNHTTSGGSTFVGRFNDTGSGLNNAQDIVFAVGTGTSTTARKTGLWIDSGSLTTINGGLYVTQSQVTLTNSGSTPGTLALAVRSGSVEVTSPQGNGYFYTNLPITSSNLRINGPGIIADLFVSGVFSGNSSLQVLGNSSFTGSVFTSASVNGVVNDLSISSNTASLDFSKGNFFTIQLVSGSSTHINPTNVAAGQTINVRVNTTGSGTVTFPTTVKQQSSTTYTPTTATGVDVLTMVTFNTSDVYLVAVKNLI